MLREVAPSLLEFQGSDKVDASEPADHRQVGQNKDGGANQDGCGKIKMVGQNQNGRISVLGMCEEVRNRRCAG